MIILLNSLWLVFRREHQIFYGLGKRESERKSKRSNFMSNEFWFFSTCSRFAISTQRCKKQVLDMSKRVRLERLQFTQQRNKTICENLFAKLTRKSSAILWTISDFFPTPTNLFRLFRLFIFAFLWINSKQRWHLMERTFSLCQMYLHTHIIVVWLFCLTIQCDKCWRCIRRFEQCS